MMRMIHASLAALACACVVAAPTTPAAPRSTSSPPASSVASSFNLFSVEQDIEIGRESSVEAEKQLTLLNEASVDTYLNDVLGALATEAPGARYPYHAKAVNDSTINAFALPGGPLYVNRGLMLAARSEAELAGVMAHEVAHVALRHGTHQASKAYLAQAGLGILGGLFGKSGGNTAQMVNIVGGLGLNAVFLKFSRDAESEADTTGAQIMARAGYDPVAMADFFAVLREESARNPSALEAFLSDHPAPAEREARIRQLAKTLPRSQSRRRNIGGFEPAQAAARRVPAAPERAVARSGQPLPSVSGGGQPTSVRVAPPSTRFATFTHPTGYFSIAHPDNWKAQPSASGYGASLFPDGGVVETSSGGEALIYGAIVNHYEPFEVGRAGKVGLESATDDLVQQIRHANSYLDVVSGSKRSENVGGASALSLELSGRSPTTGEGERVSVSTRELPDGHVIYALFIAPEREFDALAGTFSRMTRSLEVHEGATHR